MQKFIDNLPDGRVLPIERIRVHLHLKNEQFFFGVILDFDTEYPLSFITHAF